MKTHLESIIVCLIAITAVALMAIACPASSAEPPSLYTKGQLTASPFGTARIVDSEAEFGAGLEIGYSLTERLTIQADAISEGIDDSNWQDAVKSVGAGLKYYFPIKQTGFAPYLLGGYQRDLIDHENQLQAGAGIEYRINRWRIFADAQVNHGFDQEISKLGNDVLVRFGVGYQFGKN